MIETEFHQLGTLQAVVELQISSLRAARAWDALLIETEEIERHNNKIILKQTVRFRDSGRICIWAEIVKTMIRG